MQAGSLKFRNLSKRQRAELINNYLNQELKPETVKYIVENNSSRIAIFKKMFSDVVSDESMEKASALISYAEEVEKERVWRI